MKKKTIIIAITLIIALTIIVTPVYACDCPGTGTPGYWKNHPEAWPSFLDDGIWIGNHLYTKEVALEWLNTPVRNDKSITLFKAVVAAKLNYLSGCKSCQIHALIQDAFEWLDMHPVGSGVKASSGAWQCGGEELYWKLDAYNNGLLGFPHRD